MVQDLLIHLLMGTLKIFLHPVFYVSLFLAAYLGVSRVKRERKHFHVRAENAYFELRQLFPLGLVIGASISILTVVAGLVIPFAAVLLIALFTIVIGLTARVRMLSPVFTVGFSFFLLIFAGGANWQIPFFQDAFSQLDEKIYPSVAALLALLLIGEGILILKNGVKGTSPKLIKSKRGLAVGVHESKRLWMVPVFLVIPGSALQIPFEWWPVFSMGGETYSVLLLPFAIGFHQQIQGMLPKEAIGTLGKRVIVLGVCLSVLAIGSYWMPLLSIAVVVLGVIGREAFTLSLRLSDENLPFYFSRRNNGLMILGVIPGSPADKMALSVGELIVKVNGTKVRDEEVFYKAIQQNGAAYCKLEVLDVHGQVRFVQGALYEGDHHQLGVLFVQDEKKWGNEAV